MYSFRVPLRVFNSNPDTTEDRLPLAESVSEALWLQSSGPLADAEELTFRGSGYPTPEAAEQRASELYPVLRLTSLRTGIHFDFLSRDSSGGMSETTLRSMNEFLPDGVRMERHRPGVMVHLTSEEILVPRMSAAIRVHTPPHAMVEQFQSALSTTIDSSHASLAFDLYVASWRMPTNDARLLMLTSAVEAMVTVRKVSPEERAVLRRLAALVRTDDTLSTTKRSGLGSRIGSLHKESVGSASGRLAERLNPRVYLDRTPREFFAYAYEVRSRLVHGDVPPPKDEVALVLGGLATFVRDLIELEFTTPDQFHP